MKAAILGFSLSLITLIPAAAVAKDCGSPPMPGVACRAMSCDCGICSRCTTKESKYACEHKDDLLAKELMAYEACMKGNDKSGAKNQDKDGGDAHEEEHGDQD